MKLKINSSVIRQKEQRFKLDTPQCRVVYLAVCIQEIINDFNTIDQKNNYNH